MGIHNSDKPKDFKPAVPTAFMAAFVRANMAKVAEEAYKNHLREFGRKLAYSGLCLIPSEILQNNQIVVSREVYEATKDILRYDGNLEAPRNDPPEILGNCS